MRRALKIANWCVEIAVLCLILLLFAAVVYTVRDAERVIRAAAPGTYGQYKPTAESEESYRELQAKNPDVIGWITLYGTDIDYPLLQGEDNETYMTKAADGSFSLAGSIFLDTRNKTDLSDFNNLIYGHSMAGNVMFGDIGDFTDGAFFDRHRTGDLYIEGEHRGLQVLAIVQTDVYRSGLYRVPVVGSFETAAYVEEIRREALFAADELEQVGEDDRLAVLSTCTYQMSNGRHLLICRITDEVFEDPFAGAGRRSGRNTDTVGTTNRNTTILRIFLVIIAILLAAVRVTGGMNRRRREKRRAAETRRKRNLSILE